MAFWHRGHLYKGFYLLLPGSTPVPQLSLLERESGFEIVRNSLTMKNDHLHFYSICVKQLPCQNISAFFTSSSFKVIDTHSIIITTFQQSQERRYQMKTGEKPFRKRAHVVSLWTSTSTHYNNVSREWIKVLAHLVAVRGLMSQRVDWWYHNSVVLPANRATGDPSIP
jgi:hypothetical protein